MNDSGTLHEAALDLLLDAELTAAAESTAAPGLAERRVIRDETIQFARRMQREHGIAVSLDDVRESLSAAFEHVQGERLLAMNTPVRQALAQLYVDQLTLFRR